MEDSPQNNEATEEITNHKKQLSLPLDDDQIADLRAGEWVSLSGVMYLMNGRALQRLIADIEAGEELPFDLSGEVVFFAVTTPASLGKVIGSTGPEYTPQYLEPSLLLLDLGVRGFVGYGPLPEEVFTRLKKSRGLYFVTPSGASALLARRVTQSQLIAYPDLGLDAIRKIKVANFPAIVIVDGFGRNFFLQRHLSQKTEEEPFTRTTPEEREDSEEREEEEV